MYVFFYVSPKAFPLKPNPSLSRGTEKFPQNFPSWSVPPPFERSVQSTVQNHNYSSPWLRKPFSN